MKIKKYIILIILLSSTSLLTAAAPKRRSIRSNRQAMSILLQKAVPLSTSEVRQAVIYLQEIKQARGQAGDLLNQLFERLYLSKPGKLSERKFTSAQTILRTFKDFPETEELHVRLMEKQTAAEPTAAVPTEEPSAEGLQAIIENMRTYIAEQEATIERFFAERDDMQRQITQLRASFDQCIQQEIEAVQRNAQLQIATLKQQNRQLQDETMRMKTVITQAQATRARQETVALAHREPTAATRQPEIAPSTTTTTTVAETGARMPVQLTNEQKLQILGNALVADNADIVLFSVGSRGYKNQEAPGFIKALAREFPNKEIHIFSVKIIAWDCSWTS